MPTADEIEVSDFVKGYSSIDLERIGFSWNGKHAPDFSDANQAFRFRVVESVCANPGVAPVGLLRDLFVESAKWTREAWGSPPGFSKLGAELLRPGGEDTLADFVWALGRSFDTWGACHEIRLDCNPQGIWGVAVSGDICGGLGDAVYRDGIARASPGTGRRRVQWREPAAVLGAGAKGACHGDPVLWHAARPCLPPPSPTRPSAASLRRCRRCGARSGRGGFAVREPCVGMKKPPVVMTRGARYSRRPVADYAATSLARAVSDARSVLSLTAR